MTSADTTAEVAIPVDTRIYTENAVLKSAHRFTSRYFVRLESSEGHIVVHLCPKLKGDDLEHGVGEFLNDLLEQRLRDIVAAETSGIRDLIMAHALSRTNLIRPDLEDGEPFTSADGTCPAERSRAAVPQPTAEPSQYARAK